MDTRMYDWRSSNGQVLASAPPLAQKMFRQADVPAVRRFATVFGARAGMGTVRLADFVLAVSEAAACATCHGPCTARLRLWTTGSRVLCEIRGDGVLSGQGPGGVQQGDAEALRCWLLRQVCDYVSLESGPHGVTVRFSMAVS
jgi:hypothetical protein